MKERIRNFSSRILSKAHYILNEVTFDFKKGNGEWETQTREVYDKGSGAAILLYNSEKKTVILTRQLRIPIYINEGHKNGMCIEVCAGLLDGLSPEECIKKETLEETGYKIKEVTHLYDAYMTPGAVMEKVSYFVSEYDNTMKVDEGGGLDDEQEDIEVLEILFDEAYRMIFSGEITDGKTIILLQYAKLNKLF